ncbi:hypothetical protein [Desulfocurvus sp.]|nr:hypothetical protein [Desulfocurvus sp.]
MKISVNMGAMFFLRKGPQRSGAGQAGWAWRFARSLRDLCAA